MPAAVAQAIRQLIWDLSLQQQSAQQIADALKLPIRTVRHLLKAFRLQGQPTQPAFDRCGRKPTAQFASLQQQAIDLRKEHSGWGPARILAHWRCGSLKEPLPDPCTVYRWLDQAQLIPPRPAQAAPTVPAAHATRPHQIWQMDAAEKKTLASGEKVCWLRMVDEASVAALLSKVFLRDCWAFVQPGEVQQALREAFLRWGRPGGLRVDNGYPWVRPNSDLPSVLELWLAGLGVALHKNRPGVPQDNSLVERSQRTAKDWAEPSRQASAEQLQKRLEEEDRIQREVYFFDGEQSRLEAYPELLLLGSPYGGLVWEEVCWDHRASLECLGRLQLQRLLKEDRDVSLYDHHHRVEKAELNHPVRVAFSVASQEWLFYQQEKEVGRVHAAYLSASKIRHLQINRRPGRSARATQARRASQKAQAQQPAQPTATPAPNPSTHPNQQP